MCLYGSAHSLNPDSKHAAAMRPHRRTENFAKLITLQGAATHRTRRPEKLALSKVSQTNACARFTPIHKNRNDSGTNPTVN